MPFRKILSAATVVLVTTVMLTAAAHAQQEEPVLALSSPAATDGGILPSQFTCDGSGQSPPLHIENPPPHTGDYALTLVDPDAPTGNFIHWVAYNIPATTHDIAAGAASTVDLGVGAQQGLNSDTKQSYAPPCPPQGEHHYIFRLYAMDAPLALPTGSTVDKKALDAALQGHVLAQAEFTVRYARHGSLPVKP